MSADQAAAPAGVVTFPLPPISTGSDATNRGPPSLVSRCVPHRRGLPRNQHRDRSPARSLGDQTYESLPRKGETMTTAAMATYAYDQIDLARTELKHLS
jgi:hypothetical protein